MIKRCQKVPQSNKVIDSSTDVSAMPAMHFLTLKTLVVIQNSYCQIMYSFKQNLQVVSNIFCEIVFRFVFA